MDVISRTSRPIFEFVTEQKTVVVKKSFSNKKHWVDQIYSKEQRYITNEDFTLGQRVWSQGHGHFKVDIVLKTYAKSWSQNDQILSINASYELKLNISDVYNEKVEAQDHQTLSFDESLDLWA